MNFCGNCYGRHGNQLSGEQSPVTTPPGATSCASVPRPSASITPPGATSCASGPRPSALSPQVQRAVLRLQDRVLRVQRAVLLFPPGATSCASVPRPSFFSLSRCNELCFGSKTECFKCGCARGNTKDSTRKGFGKRPRPGDWDCLSCGSLNFASRDACFSCEKSRGNAEGRPKGAGKGAERREGDWDCPECEELCFASKDKCYKCGCRRP